MNNEVVTEAILLSIGTAVTESLFGEQMERRLGKATSMIILVFVVTIVKHELFG